jgi:hypothetical protein
MYIMYTHVHVYVYGTLIPYKRIFLPLYSSYAMRQPNVDSIPTAEQSAWQTPGWLAYGVAAAAQKRGLDNPAPGRLGRGAKSGCRHRREGT